MPTKVQLEQMEACYRSWARENGHTRFANLRGLDVENITDDIELLKSIVWFEQASDVLCMAYEKLHDNGVAREVAQYAALAEARSGAAVQLSDQELLKSIYLSDPAECVRHAAVLRLTDQTFLRSIIDNEDNGERVRAAAVGALTDPELLRSIAFDPNIELSTSAIYNPHLTDQSLFQFLAQHENSFFVRIAAVSRITDRQRLMEYVLDLRENGNVRRAALTNIDVKTLERLAFEDDTPNLSTNTNAVDLIEDQAILERLVYNAPSIYVRCSAARKITDQAMAMRILENVGEKERAYCCGLDSCGTGDRNGEVRAAVIGNIADKAVVTRHALMDVDFRVRRAAVGWLEDLDVLLSISENDPHPAVRKKAVTLLGIRRKTQAQRGTLID